VSPEKFIPLTSELHRYGVEHSSFRDDLTRKIEAAADDTETPQMQIAGDQAAFMTILVRATGARRALEIGTFLGYGAVAIARGLPEDGLLTCLELDADYAERAAAHLKEAGLDAKAEIKVGPALESLRALPEDPEFDFAFIDADKTEYVDYFEATLPRMKQGGLIMLDNTLRNGTVLDPGDSDAARVTAQLNDQLATDDRVDVAMLGMADGVTLALKR
jgi:caffeoyl-CoA O-methyltransferase